MKILVCIKVIKGEINPFDESALECALRLSNDVTVLSMCPKSAESALLPLTRLVAKVVLISDGAYVGSDTLTTSYILSKAESLGAKLEVTVELSDELYAKPVAVQLTGAVSPYAKQTLTQMIEEELGLNREAQRWIG